MHAPKRGSIESLKMSLSKTPLFAALDAIDRKDLIAKGTIRQYESAEQIQAHPGGKPTALFVIAGAVRVYLLSPDGNEFVFALRRRIGDSVVLPVASSEAAAITQADVLSDKCFVMIIPLDVLENLVLPNQKAASIWQALLLAQIAELRSRIAELAFFSVRERLAHVLGELACSDPEFTIHLSHRELGTIVGSSQTQITRELARLKGEGLVQFSGHRARKIVAVNALNLEGYGKANSSNS